MISIIIKNSLLLFITDHCSGTFFKGSDFVITEPALWLENLEIPRFCAIRYKKANNVIFSPLGQNWIAWLRPTEFCALGRTNRKTFLIITVADIFSFFQSIFFCRNYTAISLLGEVTKQFFHC